MIPYYEKKFEYLINRRTGKGGLCPIATARGFLERANSLHHRCHNTKTNKKKYPLFIDSLLNLLPVNNSYHLVNGSWGRISDLQAEKYQRFLEKHSKCCKFVNEVV